VRDLVSYGADPEHEAVDIGTDGTDMVWIESSGARDGGLADWPVIDIMTAKYTTDAATVASQKRRVRSELGSTGASPFIVGCGYAARAASSRQLGTGIRLVRLADGRSWWFGGTLIDATEPIAITCSELFMNANDRSNTDVVRIRIDSLGPGDAPD
jgi:hypothetical protein